MDITIKNHRLVLKDYLTARDARQINSVLLDDMEVEAGQVAKSLIKGATITKMVDEQVKVILLELDGSKENILERILDLPNEDYNAIIEKVQSIANGSDIKKN